MIILVGNPETGDIDWSVFGIDENGDPNATSFLITDTWAVDLAGATSDYLESVASIHSNYTTFQGLTDDRIEEGDSIPSDFFESDGEPDK